MHGYPMRESVRPKRCACDPVPVVFASRSRDAYQLRCLAIKRDQLSGEDCIVCDNGSVFAEFSGNSVEVIHL
eukprot:jgi/Psemu1/307798/fgenesh1_kg.354_\